MIPYDDLVAALTSWRERQGLPVRREDLFDVDASLAPFGVADALATPLVPDTGHAPDGADVDVTRLATADVLSADDSVSFEGIENEEESTFIGASPGWSGGDAPPADESEWAAAGDDATGESAVAPPADHDELGLDLDAALAERDVTADEPPGDSDAEATMARDGFGDGATALHDPLVDPGAPASPDSAALVDELEPAPGGEAEPRAAATTESDAPAPLDDALAPALDDAVAIEQALQEAALTEAGDLPPDESFAQAYEPAREPELAFEGAAPAGEPFQGAATAIRDPAFDSPFSEPAPGAGAGDLGDGDASEGEPPAGGPDDGADEDPFGP